VLTFLNQKRNALAFTQNVEILTKNMVSIIIENVKNIEDKEDEIN